MAIIIDKLKGIMMHDHPIDWLAAASNFYGTWDAALGYPIPPGDGYWIISGHGTLGGNFMQAGDYLVWWSGSWQYVFIPRFDISTFLEDITAGSWNSFSTGLVGDIRAAEFLDSSAEMINLSWRRGAGTTIEIFSVTDLVDVEITCIGSTEISIPPGPTYKTYELGVGDDTTFPILGGHILEFIVLQNNTAHEVELDIGTTLGGHELAQSIPIAGNDITTLTINALLHVSASRTIYINDDTGGEPWNHDDIDIYVTTEILLT